MEMLTVDDVLVINRKIVEDARNSSNPIAIMNGTGISSSVKDLRLLESAVARQHIGAGGELIYDTVCLNAATLMFGVAKNHAFHDGNKRTSLVAMLNHLDRNRFMLADVTWKEVEAIVLSLVVGTLPEDPKLRHVCRSAADRHERDVRALAEWLRQHCRRVEHGERRMKFDQLNTLLKKHGFELGHPDGNFISIYKVIKETKKPLFQKERTELRLQRIGLVGYPGGKKEIGILDLKQVRKICKLTEEFGVDSAIFYDREGAVDEIINRNRRVLRSLANK